MPEILFLGSHCSQPSGLGVKGGRSSGGLS